MTVSFVIMAYNERETIKKVVTDILSEIDHLSLEKYEILIIDDGSTDGTSNIATVVPFAVSKDTIAIVFGPGTTTRKNIMATKTARAIVRYTDQKTAKGLDIFGNVGSRLLLKLLEDKKECEKYFKANEPMFMKMMARSAEDVVFLKIKEVYPLG